MPHNRNLHACLAALAAMAAAASPAAADHSLQALATASTGYTDNVQAVPSNPADTMLTPRRTSDAFANIAPGIVFAHEGPRITQVLRYTLNIRLYAEQSGADSFGNSLAYGAIVPISPRASFSLNASAGHGRLNAFNIAPEATPVAGQGRGDQSYAQGAVDASYNYILTPSWGYQQSVGASIYQPTDETTQIGRRLTFNGGLSLSKTFNYHAFTLTGRGRYTTLDGGEDTNGMALPDEKTFIVGPELRWVHDLTLDFSTDAMIGASVSWPAGEYQDREVFPVGAAYLRYAHDRYAAAVGYRRNVATNIILGETDVTHVVEARGVVPLPFADKLSLAGSVGYLNGRSIGVLDAAGRERAGKTVEWIGDTSVAWQFTDAMLARLRYQRVWQDRRDPRVVDPAGTIIEEHMRRQQIEIVFEGRYPTRQAAELPTDPSTRVDSGLESMTKREESLVR